MSIVDTKGVMSSKKGVAEVNNGLPGKRGMDLSQIRWNFRKRERGHSWCLAGTEVGLGMTCWERVVAQWPQMKICALFSQHLVYS